MSQFVCGGNRRGICLVKGLSVIQPKMEVTRAHIGSQVQDYHRQSTIIFFQKVHTPAHGDYRVKSHVIARALQFLAMGPLRLRESKNICYLLSTALCPRTTTMFAVKISPSSSFPLRLFETGLATAAYRLALSQAENKSHESSKPIKMLSV